MRGLEYLKQRLEFAGGITAESRFQKDKLKTLKKALLYSYQAETAILSDGRMFRCLINTDRTKADYDCKIISIPYEDVCLGKMIEEINPVTGETIKVKVPYYPNSKTKDGIEKIGMKCGDVFEWAETGTYWLVYLEKLEEDSYFRAEIYKCEEEVEINGQRYHAYIRGPVETTIQWDRNKNKTWNDLNYSLVIYITKDENTLNYLHRFAKVKLGGKTWIVATVDSYSADGIIEVCLNEWFENAVEENQKEEDKKIISSIIGPSLVHPFDTCKYFMYELEGGHWRIDDPRKAVIRKNYEECIIVEIITGKSGSFNLIYETTKEKIVLPIKIESI